MSDTKLFPGAVIQMIKVGENTGTLNEQLGVGSDYYGEELEYKIQRLTALVRARRDHLHGHRRRVRRGRADLRDVRHLQAGAGLMGTRTRTGLRVTEGGMSHAHT